jgi:hypothetical protein
VEERKTERKSKREREREGECHLNGFPWSGVPGLGCHRTENAQPVSQAKQWAPQAGVGVMPGTVPVTSETRERERERERAGSL